MVDVLAEKQCFVVDWLLAGNRFENSVCIFIADQIKKQRAVREIDLRGNRVNDDGVTNLIKDVANKAQGLGPKDMVNPPPIVIQL